MQKFKTLAASRLAVFIGGAVLVIGLTWPLMGTAQVISDKAKDPDPHSQHKDHQPAGDQDLVKQIALLQEKVARLEAIIEKSQASGMTAMAGKSSDAMESMGDKKKPVDSMGLMDIGAMKSTGGMGSGVSSPSGEMAMMKKMEKMMSMMEKINMMKKMDKMMGLMEKMTSGDSMQPGQGAPAAGGMSGMNSGVSPPSGEMAMMNKMEKMMSMMDKMVNGGSMQPAQGAPAAGGMSGMNSGASPPSGEMGMMNMMDKMMGMMDKMMGGGSMQPSQGAPAMGAMPHM